MASDAPVPRLREHLLRSATLSDARHLLVGVSGGLDSVALLHALRFQCGARWRVSAAHLDHAMREDSAAAASWVRGLCAAWGVPLVEERCAEPPVGEAAARRLRYAFLRTAAHRLGADRIVTAHHLDDQAETLLLRLARGTGVDGLAGIRPRRGILARPLLDVSRAQLRAYAGAVGLRWREDSSNRDLRYARNRVRRVVLPALEAVHPRAAAHIARLAGHAARQRTAWSELVRDALDEAALTPLQEPPFVLARERLLAYHPEVRARVLRTLARRCGAPLDSAGTARAVEFISRGGSGRSLQLRGGLRLQREFDTIRMQAHVVTRERPVLRVESPGAGAGVWGAGEGVRSVCWGPGRPPESAGLSAAFDPSQLRFPLEFRTWQSGDRIRLRYGTKKVKKLFQEARIGRGARHGWPVLADAGGRILWIPGLARTAGGEATGEPAFHITVADGDSL